MDSPRHIAIEALVKIRNSAVLYAGVYDHPCKRIHELARDALHKVSLMEGWDADKSSRKKQK